MFAIVALTAIGSLAIRIHLDRLPLQIMPYSTKSRDDALNNGQCVLVTIYGNWAVDTADPLRLLSRDVTLRIRRRNILVMSADWTDHASHVTALMNELDVKTVPVLAFNDPGARDKPTIIFNFPDEKHVLSVIDACCR
jgi:thiol:disulfide interchange protein